MKLYFLVLVPIIYLKFLLLTKIDASIPGRPCINNTCPESIFEKNHSSECKISRYEDYCYCQKDYIQVDFLGFTLGRMCLMRSGTGCSVSNGDSTIFMTEVRKLREMYEKNPPTEGERYHADYLEEIEDAFSDTIFRDGNKTQKWIISYIDNFIKAFEEFRVGKDRGGVARSDEDLFCASGSCVNFPNGERKCSPSVYSKHIRTGVERILKKSDASSIKLNFSPLKHLAIFFVISYFI